MGLTITEKIIAHKANLERVSPGQIVQVPVDFAFLHYCNNYEQ